MKFLSDSFAGTIVPRLRRFIIAALVFLTTLNLRADAPPTSLNLRYTGTDFEGRQSFQIEWNAISNATYLVQSATSLSTTDAWKTVDVVTPTNGAGQFEIKGRSIPENSVEFFRFILPQPQIFSVEPAVFASDVAVDAYVIGQCFESNDVVRVDGAVLGGVIYVSGGLLQCTLPPSSVGPHLVELVHGGVPVSSFTVQNTGGMNSGTPALQGPPDEPLASPQALWLSKKGYDYYKARSDMNAARTGEKTPRDLTKSALKIALKLSGGGGIGLRENDDVVFDVAEGKKGLNAVNVKLASRVAGGVGDDCDDGNDSDPEFSLLMPALMKAKEKANRMMCSGVAPYSGEVQECDVDLAVEGRGLDFVWGRTYHSRQTQSTSFGERWTSSYDANIQPLGGDIVIHDGTGRADTFKLNTNGVYSCPEFFSEGTLTGGVFRLAFADTGYWEFNPLTASADAGKLAHIVDRNGNTISLNYDGSGQLTQIVDDLDRTNTVAYNLAGQLASVTDFSGRTVTYSYYQGGELGGSPGDLKSVTSPPVTGTPNGNDFPDGKTTTYTYSRGFLDDRENHLLLSVIDATGQPVCTHVYQHNQTDLEFLRCISVQHWTNTPTMISYLPQTPTPTNQFATLRCIVNDPIGDVTECCFDARNRCVKLQEFTGRATAGVAVTDVSNRPTGKLRVADPDYFETRYEWNVDSLRVSTKEPAKLEIPNLRYVYESDFNPGASPHKRADLRVVRELAAAGGVDLDGDGVADATERVWRFEYDPRFGSSGDRYLLGLREYDPLKQYLSGDTQLYNNMRTRINELEARLQNLGILARSSGWGKVDNSDLDIASARAPAGVTHEYHRFATSATDPRGNLTTGNYDPNGNLTNLARYKRKDGAIISADFNYKEHGRLAAITNAPDGNGYRRVDTFDYYTNGPQAGYLKSVVIDDRDLIGLRLTTSYEYDARGNLTRYIDPRTNDWLYTYNALDQIVESSSATLSLCFCKIKVDYSYDANDNVTLIAEENRDATGKLGTNAFWHTQFIYDGGQRLTAGWQDKSGPLDLRGTEIKYDAADHLVLYRSPEAVNGHDPLNTVAFEYDERGLLFREIGAPGSGNSPTNEYDYNPNGQTSRVNKIEALVIKQKTFTHDGFGRVATVTDSMGNQTTFNFDANDNLKVVRGFGQLNDAPGPKGNLRLAESRFECDDEDRVVARHDLHFNPATQSPIGDGERTTTFAYAPNGGCTNVTDDLGRVTTYAYDTAGRLSSVSSPGGRSVVACVRDAAGNITQTTQTDASDLGGPPQVFARTNVYDALNRCVSTTDNVGNATRFAYDSRDNCVSTTDALGNETVYGYDGLSRVMNFTKAQGAASSGIVVSSGRFDYDDNDRCIASTDANGNVTLHAYDSLNRCTQTTQADGTHNALVWSPRSNLIQETDANGTVVVHTYDLNDRCISNSITPGTGVAVTTTAETFAYDGDSRLVAATNDVADSEFEYDSLGNRVRDVSGGVGAVVRTFDGAGNRLSITYPSGRLVTYSYDALDQVTNVSSGAGGLPQTTLATFAYEGPGRIGRITRANNVNTRIQWDGLVSPPNGTGDFGWGQIKGINHQVAGGGAVIDQRRATCDQKQNKTLRAQTVPFYQGGDTTTNVFEYDPMDRLSRAINTKGTGSTMRFYTLDGNGNCQFVLSNGVAEPYLMDATIPPADFQMNQYTITPFGSQSYDDNGNLIAKNSSTAQLQYQYDYADRLVQVNDLLTGAIVPVASFSYDALGRRISKTSYPPAPLAPVTTLFVYDGADIIEEHADGALQFYAVWPHMHQIATHMRISPAGAVLYAHADDLGNVLALTDTAGSVVERYEYDDFGAPSFLTSDGFPMATNSSPVGNPFLFHGMEWDSETGLYLATKRFGIGDTAPECPLGVYFDPQTGRAVRGKVKTIKDGGNGFFDNNPWSQHSINNINGGMPNRISMNVTVPKQTQGATFGEKVNQGLHAAGGALAGKLIVPVAMDKGLRFEDGSMTATLPRNILKSFFQTGDKPTQAQQIYQTISNVLKTKHDTAKNSIGNIR